MKDGKKEAVSGSKSGSYEPPRSGTVIISTDPDPAPDLDPVINKQKKEKPLFLHFCDFSIAC
jgi:hypothetical protein